MYHMGSDLSKLLKSIQGLTNSHEERQRDEKLKVMSQTPNLQKLHEYVKEHKLAVIYTDYRRTVTFHTCQKHVSENLATQYRRGCTAYNLSNDGHLS